MILSGGEIVDVLASSGLGQYAQFYPMVFFFILFNINHAQHSISALVEKEGNAQLLKLPCSRQEIFNNKSISLKDKRLLTKFIQYIIDYSVKSVDEAKELNDIELKQGRSLSRPQNKSVMVIDLSSYANTPFVDFLAKEFQITGLLKDMIVQVIEIDNISLDIPSD